MLLESFFKPFNRTKLLACMGGDAIRLVGAAEAQQLVANRSTVIGAQHGACRNEKTHPSQTCVHKAPTWKSSLTSELHSSYTHLLRRPMVRSHRRMGR